MSLNIPGMTSLHEVLFVLCMQMGQANMQSYIGENWA
jgi:hypothetical protein